MHQVFIYLIFVLYILVEDIAQLAINIFLTSTKLWFHSLVLQKLKIKVIFRLYTECIVLVALISLEEKCLAEVTPEE